MKTRHALTVLVAVIATPLVLGLGTVLVIPVALLLLPVVLIAAVAAIPALFVWSSHAAQPAVVAVPTVAVPANAPVAG
jgi:hypothetical protein